MTGKIQKGDEVIVPANTYIASILAILEADLVPILVEPRLEAYTIDSEKIEAKIKQEKTIIEQKLKHQLVQEQQEQFQLLQKELNEKSEQIKELNRTKAEIEKLKREKLELKEAIEANLYTKENYSQNPREYCGIKVSDSPLE